MTLTSSRDGCMAASEDLGEPVVEELSYLEGLKGLEERVHPIAI